ncbi:FG-GAP repeat domain-containing protein [Chachezhania antarctica]|uniref:FG-GAP repeat domain-containing protein n=1 Tax=Chachezhania antarctica TaxID=2340860 RepID=UPI000EABA79D|nr:VCBS repeat-containing protein [Chachezhania antarctica]|tara:strand:- start:1151 stop:1861 length:711 start_codon:yes stop_codon:yes gene_type:complete
MRGAAQLAAVLCSAAALAGAARADIVSAHYTEPTTRYAHGVLGDAVEWGALELTSRDGDASVRSTLLLPESRVFEDTAPRLVDVDGDGDVEVIVVETDVSLGAQLAIYDETGKIAATPHIGRANRWLAPSGAGDMDGDGFVEIAYVDRPHLARELKILRFRNGKLEPVATVTGVTNHRIGDPEIAGGLRTCGARPELVLLDSGWRNIVLVHLEGGRPVATALNHGPSQMDAVLACR